MGTIERRDPDPKVTSIKERRVPEWVRRAKEGRLPVADKTGTVAA